VAVTFCLAVLAWATSALGDTRSAARLWGAVERVDAEIGPTYWRNQSASYAAQLAPEVLDLTQALAAGRRLTTAQAVELGLGAHRPVSAASSA